jgi:hypothetical protein
MISNFFDLIICVSFLDGCALSLLGVALSCSRLASGLHSQPLIACLKEPRGHRRAGSTSHSLCGKLEDSCTQSHVLVLQFRHSSYDRQRIAYSNTLCTTAQLTRRISEMIVI